MHQPDPLGLLKLWAIVSFLVVVLPILAARAYGELRLRLDDRRRGLPRRRGGRETYRYDD